VSGSLAAYARFEIYLPRESDAPSFLAGPKRAFVERVEWHTIPEAVATGCYDGEKRQIGRVSIGAPLQRLSVRNQCGRPDSSGAPVRL